MSQICPTSRRGIGATTSQPLLAPGRSRTSRRSLGVARRVRVRASDDAELDRQLQDDLERVKLREQRQREADFNRGMFNPVSIRPAGGAASQAGGPSGLEQAVDKFLIADFFFVLFAAVWLVAGLGVKVATESTAVLDTWLLLWQWVFQPAIGVLMLGTIVQGTRSWARDKYGDAKK